MDKVLFPHIKDIKKTAKLLWDKGWAEKNAGNFSINVTQEIINNTQNINDELHNIAPPCSYLANNYLLITSSGSRMRDISETPENYLFLIQINNHGTGYYQKSLSENVNDLQPSSELPTHLLLHNKLKKDNNSNKVILHAHITEFIALTHIPKYQTEKTINDLIWGMHPETKMFIPEGIGLVKYQTPGTQDIAMATLKKLNKNNIIIWEKHGCIALNNNLEQALDILDIATKSITIFFMCKSSGYKPEGLT